MSTATTETNKWLTFYLGRQLYAINALMVREIIRRPELHGTGMAESGHSRGIEGLIAYRGTAVTVINGLQRMAIRDEAEAGMLVVLTVGDQQAALAVTRMGDVEDYKAADFQPVQASTDPAIFGVIRDEDRLVIGLSAEQLLNELDA